MDPRITYFPVGNGHCSLITLSDKTQIIIDCNTTAEAFRKEAQRRITLHLARSAERNSAGNRIRVVGHSNNPAYKGLGDLVVTPGNYINVIDRKQKADFRFFVHAPFRKEVDSKLA